MLGPRIAALRRRAGLSQAELARKLGVSPSAVGMYEQGRREPSAQMLVTMADAFGVSTDYLLTGKPRSGAEQECFTDLLLEALRSADQNLETRKDKPFTRQELAVLVAAMLTEP